MISPVFPECRASRPAHIGISARGGLVKRAGSARRSGSSIGRGGGTDTARQPSGHSVGEIALTGEAAIDRAGNSGGYRSAHVPASGEHHDDGQLMPANVVERAEPPHMAGGAEVRAGAGFTKNRIIGITPGA